MYAELTSRSVSSELVSTRPSHAFNVTLCTPCTVSHKLRHKRNLRAARARRRTAQTRDPEPPDAPAFPAPTGRAARAHERHSRTRHTGPILITVLHGTVGEVTKYQTRFAHPFSFFRDLEFSRAVCGLGSPLYSYPAFWGRSLGYQPKDGRAIAKHQLAVARVAGGFAVLRHLPVHGSIARLSGAM